MGVVWPFQGQGPERDHRLVQPPCCESQGVFRVATRRPAVRGQR
jgi:hypothetical protein